MKPTDIGILVACAHAKVNPSVLPVLTGFHSGMRKAAGADQMGRDMAGLARDIFVAAGRSDSLEAHIYDQLTKVAHWEPVHFDFLRPVYSALGGVAPELGLEKKAEDGWLGSVLKNMFGAAVIGGGALGTLHWAVNRDAAADDAKSKSLMARTDLYRRMADEISQELKDNPPQDVESAIKRKSREQQVV